MDAHEPPSTGRSFRRDEQDSLAASAALIASDAVTIPLSRSKVARSSGKAIGNSYSGRSGFAADIE
jgi:hypothetical protein